MRNLRIQHGLYKNLPSNTIYNSQAAWLIFGLGLAFKVSAMPGLLNEKYGSSTFWAFALLLGADVVGTCFIFAFVRMRGDDFLRCTASMAYRALCLLASAFFVLKGTFYFSYCVSYLTHELFGGVAPNLLYLLFISPVVYIGLKGARSLSRTAEIFVPLVGVLVIFNLVCLDTDLDFGRNLPVFALPPSEFFAQLPHYGLWLGDALPFLFLRIKNKRLPYLSGGIAATVIVALSVVLIGVATYGESLETVSDLLIRIAGFNKLTLEIGRMEWTNLFCIITLAIIALSFLYFGANTALERATKCSLPAKVAYPVVMATVTMAVPSAQSVANFALEEISYLLTAFALLLPVAIFATAAVQKRRLWGIYSHFDDEYTPYPVPDPIQPQSLADGILAGFKTEAQRTQTVKDCGTLEPGGDQ